MRVRADQVRAGQRISGATVTRVRQVLERGTVRLTLVNDDHLEGRDAPGGRSSLERGVADSSMVADGTFCYRSNDILDVDNPRS